MINNIMQNTRFGDYFYTIIVPSIFVTIKIVLISAFFSILLGLFLGSILILTSEDGLNPNKIIYSIIDKFTNLIRGFPTLILIIALGPLTRLVVGTAVGTNAAIFSITIACTPFATRMTENSLKTVNETTIKAAISFGAKKSQVIKDIMLSEALPNLISNFTIMLINMLNVTALAGAVGAGGLGAVALTYGYQQYDNVIMYFIVILLIIFVLLIEKLNKILYKILK
ncbi:ABC transporter permease subunit [Peptostreptococcus russellii]|uniref:methionine ABC transporter permease n=1 Tax=Peptostreptococcus russellii TaxID=215200 RepID=UPI00162ABD85|nr:ABC transporter permease subunit [Peptostreptococcus russellii]MBC2576971.1 ABC transporter permease subunit [Peptostreptococcus russellii]